MSMKADKLFDHDETRKFCFTCGARVDRIYRTGYYKENGNAVVFETRKCPKARWYSVFWPHHVTEDEALSSRIF